MPTTRREGWKEIAAHFGVGVRTVQIWEVERSLPVRRLPGPRGRVYAEVTELEHWRFSYSDGLPGEELQNPFRRIAIAVISLVLLSAASWWYWRSLRTRQPSDFTLVGSHLTVLDQRGRPLFQTELGGPVFRAWEIDSVRDRPLAVDINGDGDREFLFPWKQGETAAESDQLLCFSRTGTLLWSFRAGKPIRSGKEPFSLPFRIARFGAVNLGGGRRAVIVTSHHHLYYPSQVALLTVDGQTIREYWHSGQLNALLVTDFNSDGRDEIYLGGTANGPKRAALVALDPLTMGGASSERDPEYQIQGFPPPVESARLLLQRSAANQKTALYNSVIRLFRESEHLVAEVTEVHEKSSYGVVFHRFDANLQHAVVSAGDGMTEGHQRLLTQGLTNVSLADDLRRIAEPEWITRPRH